MAHKPIAFDMAGAASAAEDVDVKVRTDEDGQRHAYLIPRSLRGLSAEAERIAADVQLIGRQRLQLDDNLEYQVRAGRAAGLSWPALGWCLGVTGEAMRKAYGA